MLWYGLFLFNALGESAGCRLCSWDILRGGEPVDHGFIASDLRGVHTLSEVEGRGDRLYICDGNHLFDRCGMLCVDLAALRQAEAAGVTGPLCHDAAPYLPVKGGRELYPYDDFEERGGAYLRYMNRIKDHWQFYAANSESMSAPDTRVVRLWERVGFGMPVRALSFAEDGSLTGVCGQETALAFTIRDGALTDIPAGGRVPAGGDDCAAEGTRLPPCRGGSIWPNRPPPCGWGTAPSWWGRRTACCAGSRGSGCSPWEWPASTGRSISWPPTGRAGGCSAWRGMSWIWE